MNRFIIYEKFMKEIGYNRWNCLIIDFIWNIYCDAKFR